MSPRTQRFVLAVAVTLLPRSALAGPDATADPSDATANAMPSHVVRMSIETSAMGDEAESTRAWVLRDGTASLAEAGVMVDPEATTEVRVVIEPKDLGYTVSIEVREDDQERPLTTRGTRLCETCTRTELVGLVGRELAWVGGWLSTSSEDGKSAEGAIHANIDEGSGTSEPDVASITNERPPRRLHALDWAGIGVGTLGLGTLVGGLVLTVRNYKAEGEPGGYLTPSVNPRHAGWAMVGVGAAAATGGAVMVVLDLVRRRPHRVAAGPWLNGQAAGLWVRRRF